MESVEKYMLFFQLQLRLHAHNVSILRNIVNPIAVFTPVSNFFRAVNLADENRS